MWRFKTANVRSGFFFEAAARFFLNMKERIAVLFLSVVAVWVFIEMITP